MRILISGGGTGGHIYPAIAIAVALQKRLPQAQILFVGAEGKMEMEKVPKAGFQIIGLPIAGFNRSSLLSNLSFPSKLLRSLQKAREVVSDFRPDIAIGVGGYASGPTLFMASLQGVPLVIQEQNSYAGVTNKLLSKRARKICVAYPNMERFFPADRLIFTGNPVREDICTTLPSVTEARAHFGLDPAKKTLLVIGGSQGARSINQCMQQILSDLRAKDYQIIWQTGSQFRSSIDQYKQPGVFISEFIYEMAFAYAAADVVVSRAGALSVSELCIVQKPAILVPFPNAAEDHQTKNARSLSDHQAAWLVEDNQLMRELLPAITTLLEDPAQCAMLSANMKSFAKPQAAADIAEQIIQLIPS